MINGLLPRAAGSAAAALQACAPENKGAAPRYAPDKALGVRTGILLTTNRFFIRPINVESGRNYHTGKVGGDTWHPSGLTPTAFANKGEG